jgi:hypothetical protein
LKAGSTGCHGSRRPAFAVASELVFAPAVFGAAPAWLMELSTKKPTTTDTTLRSMYPPLRKQYFEDEAGIDDSVEPHFAGT